MKSYISYDYYPSGDIEQQRLSEPGNPALLIYDYTYDDRLQLTFASGPRGFTMQSGYTDGGRLQSMDMTATGAARMQARHVTYEYMSGNPEQLDILRNVSDGTTWGSYTYDLSGNVLQRTIAGEPVDFTYSSHNRMVQSNTSDGRSEQYFYRGQQRFLLVSYTPKQEVDKITYWFGPGKFDYDAAGTEIGRRVNVSLGSQPVAEVRHDGLSFLTHNIHQHLMYAFGKNGAFEVFNAYTPSGELLVQAGPDNTNEKFPNQFNGKHFHRANFTYYGYRYYDPLSLRWLREDPKYQVAPDQGLFDPRRSNLYTFSLNNTLRYVDPDGRDNTSAKGPGPVVMSDERIQKLVAQCIEQNNENIFIQHDCRAVRNFTNRDETWTKEESGQFAEGKKGTKYHKGMILYSRTRFEGYSLKSLFLGDDDVMRVIVVTSEEGHYVSYTREWDKTSEWIFLVLRDENVPTTCYERCGENDRPTITGTQIITGLAMLNPKTAAIVATMQIAEAAKDGKPEAIVPHLIANKLPGLGKYLTPSQHALAEKGRQMVSTAIKVEKAVDTAIDLAQGRQTLPAYINERGAAKIKAKLGAQLKTGIGVIDSVSQAAVNVFVDEINK